MDDNQTTNDNSLTKYKSGSIREVLHIAFPLMIATFSYNFMLFIDRIILAQYSIDYFNAASVISIVAVIFQMMSVNVTSIAEVFIGQHYGSKRFDQVARPVWQMIYFAISLLPIFILIGTFAGDVLVPERYGAEGRQYFFFLMLYSVIPAINAAIASFFIARGKTFIITISSVISNILNVILAYPLILGVEGFIPALGLLGSVYAAMAAFSVQTLIMLMFFLTKDNIKRFDALNLKIDFNIIKNCLKIGIPNAISHSVEIVAWAAIIRYLSELTDEHITITSIAQNFFILIAFFSEAMQKSVIAISSNALGSNNSNSIRLTLKSAIKVMLSGFCIAAVPFIAFPEATLKIFLNNVDDHVIQLGKIALTGSLLYFLLDGLTWIYAAILTSGGDTKFIMFVNTINSWLCAFLPIFLFVNEQTPPAVPWLLIMPAYALINLIIFAFRYSKGKWVQQIT